MALRSFTAPDGRAWHVWQVIPYTGGGAAEHKPGRANERRGQDVLLYKGPERRVRERRRSQVTRALTPGLERGWLVFESETAKRRLVPPPAEWEQLSDAALSTLWARAEVVAKYPGGDGISGSGSAGV
ncbi:MAG TPA: hypothetical protein VE913_17715 [Longimicrobium sp.]|nr:hypothetical protein [Longimicrobium sp.]